MPPSPLHTARTRLLELREAGQLSTTANPHPAWLMVEAEAPLAGSVEALCLLRRPRPFPSLRISSAVPLDARDSLLLYRRTLPLADIAPLLLGPLRRRFLHDLRARHGRALLAEALMALAVVTVIASCGGAVLFFFSPLVVLPFVFALLRLRDALRGAEAAIRVDLDVSAHEALDGFFVPDPSQAGG